MQAKFIEEETHRRIEDIVNKRVEEELAKRKIDIDEEVMKKVEEAKKHVEQHLQIEYDRKQEELIDKYKEKEVRFICLIYSFFHSRLCPNKLDTPLCDMMVHVLTGLKTMQR